MTRIGSWLPALVRWPQAVNSNEIKLLAVGGVA